MNLLQKVCCQSIDVGQISCPPCPTCMHQLQSTIDYAFKLCGSIGLFFSFTEVRFRAKRRHVTYHVYIYCTGYNIKCCTEYDLLNTIYLIFKSSIRKCTYIHIAVTDYDESTLIFANANMCARLQFVGVWLTVRYRNQKDPRANPSAFL